MLYDILPPIIFFMSLGGIIVVVSRVVLRVRREQFSEEVKSGMATAANPIKPDVLLKPAQKGMDVVKSRLGLVVYYLRHTGNYIKKVSANAKQSWEERRAAKQARVEVAAQEDIQEETKQPVRQEEVDENTGIELPTSNWRDKVAVFYKNSVDNSKQAISKVQTKVKTKLEERALRREEELKTKTLALQEEETAAPVEEEDVPKIKVTRIDNSKADLLKTAVKKEEEQAASRKKAQQDEEKQASTGSRLMAQFLKRDEKKSSSPLDSAKVALEGGQYQRVEDILIPHIIKNSKDTKAYMLLGRASLARQTWDEAIEIFEQVIKINPDQKGAYASLGFAAYKAGRFTRALQALQRAHDNDPTNIKVLEHLLAIAERMDNKVLKRSVLEDLVVLDPKQKGYKEKLAKIQEKEKVRV